MNKSLQIVPNTTRVKLLQPQFIDEAPWIRDYTELPILAWHITYENYGHGAEPCAFGHPITIEPLGDLWLLELETGVVVEVEGFFFNNRVEALQHFREMEELKREAQHTA